MKKLVVVAAALLPIVFGGPAMAESEAEQTAKNLCAGCHGPNGISTNPLWPNLAGQQAGYMVKQMLAYRDGIRVDPTMYGLTQTLSDAQIEALAAYYSKLPGGG